MADHAALDREKLLLRAVDHEYSGGVNGTWYECPFASPPLDMFGNEEPWENVYNDPTEAYFRCSLPGRDNDTVKWGEYAPCTVEEWVAGVQAATSGRTEAARAALDRLTNAAARHDNDPEMLLAIAVLESAVEAQEKGEDLDAPWEPVQ